MLTGWTRLKPTLKRERRKVPITTPINPTVETIKAISVTVEALSVTVKALSEPQAAEPATAPSKAASAYPCRLPTAREVRARNGW